MDPDSGWDDEPALFLNVSPDGTKEWARPWPLTVRVSFRVKRLMGAGYPCRSEGPRARRGSGFLW